MLFDCLLSLLELGLELLVALIVELVLIQNVVGVAFLLDLFFFGFGFGEALRLALLFYLLRLLLELLF